MARAPAYTRISHIRTVPWDGLAGPSGSGEGGLPSARSCRQPGRPGAGGDVGGFASRALASARSCSRHAGDFAPLPRATAAPLAAARAACGGNGGSALPAWPEQQQRLRRCTGARAAAAAPAAAHGGGRRSGPVRRAVHGGHRRAAKVRAGAALAPTAHRRPVRALPHANLRRERRMGGAPSAGGGRRPLRPPKGHQRRACPPPARSCWKAPTRCAAPCCR